MGEEERGKMLSKRFADKEEEVDYKTKAGTAWSHSFLNQKPWHPLSYPNQRRKWIAEQTHAQRQRRAEEITREYAQEQEFFRQTSLLSQKEKEKVDAMQAVSFMYVRPPGYNAESAKAAEISDERKRVGESAPTGASSSLVPQEAAPVKEEKRKPRPKDVFGRSLPTEEEFVVLKNAPRLETGVPARVKPFAVEVRNVKCVRCGNFGHQSGDRECPLKDSIMPNDENRLKRDDPLTAILAHMESSEPLKWELKQKPGISPPRGGFMPDDPNQQIIAEEIFDEYGGFLSGGDIPDLLTNFSSGKQKKKKSKSKTKHKKRPSSTRSNEYGSSTSDSYDDRRSSKTKSKSKSKHKSQALPTDSDEGSDSSSEYDKHRRRSRRKEQLHKSKKKDLSHSEDSEVERYQRNSSHEHSHQDDHLDSNKRKNSDSARRGVPREDSSLDGKRKLRRKEKAHRSHNTTRNDFEFSSLAVSERYRRKKHKHSYSSTTSDSDDHRGSRQH